ncbi:10548_t:CDS:1, partial [Paraglomus brasilianum]
WSEWFRILPFAQAVLIPVPVNCLNSLLALLLNRTNYELCSSYYSIFDLE